MHDVQEVQEVHEVHEVQKVHDVQEMQEVLEVHEVQEAHETMFQLSAKWKKLFFLCFIIPTENLAFKKSKFVKLNNDTSFVKLAMAHSLFKYQH